jgi:polar amino acid transport system ATP-binding protein
MSTIEIRGLSKKFGMNVVLDGVDLTIEQGTVVSIIGPSGTGKSTLLRCLNLLEQPEQGSVLIDGTEFNLHDVKGKQLHQLRQYTEMVFQQFNLFKLKTVLQNVMEGLIVVKKYSRKDAERIARSQLEKVGLGSSLYHYPSHLSGGQQQRVAIARALAMEPQLLLMDEPTSALDPELVGEVLATIRKVAQDGNTILLVTHEMNFVRQVSNKVIFLEKGKIIEQGTPRELFERPQSLRLKEFLLKTKALSNIDYVI